MKLSLTASVVALALALSAAACSGNDGEIKLDAAATPLTDKGSDALFTLEIVKARDGGYASDTIKVKVTPEDKDAIEVACTVTDVNGNKVLDSGDKLSCAEGADNKLGDRHRREGGERGAVRHRRRSRGARRRRDLDAREVVLPHSAAECGPSSLSVR